MKNGGKGCEGGGLPDMPSPPGREVAGARWLSSARVDHHLKREHLSITWKKKWLVLSASVPEGAEPPYPGGERPSCWGMHAPEPPVENQAQLTAGLKAGISSRYLGTAPKPCLCHEAFSRPSTEKTLGRR